ncbi:uncharacterized protein CCR75_009802 [Bremia lactucae]|uniref:Uncharacterized protein n=1 Tax=Bremia lactucae TaxID=4779 RepID=A0A976FK46_BRELC|nr:hypothetical protein CCR75_009802 [Bremia lactucae]
MESMISSKCEDPAMVPQGMKSLYFSEAATRARWMSRIAMARNSAGVRYLRPQLPMPGRASPPGRNDQHVEHSARQRGRYDQKVLPSGLENRRDNRGDELSKGQLGPESRQLADGEFVQKVWRRVQRCEETTM